MLLASHLAQALAPSVSHHNVFYRTVSTVFVFSFGHVSNVFKVERWSRFRQLLHPGDANGQEAVALHS